MQIDDLIHVLQAIRAKEMRGDLPVLIERDIDGGPVKYSPEPEVEILPNGRTVIILRGRELY